MSSQSQISLTIIKIGVLPNQSLKLTAEAEVVSRGAKEN